MNEWYQQMLTPPEVVEVRARIGVLPSADHAQAYVEVVDPTTGVQVAAWSSPHTTLAALPTWLATVLAKLEELVLAQVDPF